MRTELIEVLRASGFEAISKQVAPSHARLEVSKGGERVIVDLVAERVPFVEAPMEATVDGVAILVDTPHEILVSSARCSPGPSYATCATFGSCSPVAAT